MEWNGPTGGHRPDASVMRNKSAIGEVEEEAPIPVDSPSPTPQLEIFSSIPTHSCAPFGSSRDRSWLFFLLLFITRQGHWWLAMRCGGQLATRKRKTCLLLLV